MAPLNQKILPILFTAVFPAPRIVSGIQRRYAGSSTGEESPCNAGDADSVSGLGRSTGERVGYPLQYSWASHAAQLVKNPPAMQVRSLGWEDPLEKGKATHFSILAWRISWTVESMGSERVGHN